MKKRTGFHERFSPGVKLVRLIYREEYDTARGQDRGHQRAQEINGMVPNSTLPLQRGAEKAIQEHTGDGPAKTVGEITPWQQPRKHADRCYERGGCNAGKRTDRADPTICSGRNQFPGGNQTRLTIASLTQFAGNSVGGGFGKSGNKRSQEHRISV